MNTSRTARRRVLLILGMHRSGTSPAARVVNLLGAELGSDLVPAGADNPEGFWEHAEAVRINEAILHGLGRTWYDMRDMPREWIDSPPAKAAMLRIGALIDRDFARSDLCAIKDPRMCLTAPLWIEAFRAAGFKVACLFVVRDPREVVESLHRRNRWPRAALYLMWVQYLMEAFAASAPRHRAMITYDQLILDWRGSMARVAGELSLHWPAAASGDVANAIDAFLDPRHRHHQGAPPAAERGDAPIPDLTETLHRTCRGIAAGKNGWAAMAKLRGAFRNTALLYSAHVDHLSAERWGAEERAQTAEAHAARQASTEAVVQRLKDGLDSRLGTLEQAMAGAAEQASATAAVRDTILQLKDRLDARLGALEQAVAGIAEQAGRMAVELSDQSAETAARLERHRESLMAVEARVQRQFTLLNTMALRLEQATGGDPGAATRLDAVDALLRREMQNLQSSLAASDAMVAALTSSTSWKLTAPMRWLGVHLLRRPPPLAGSAAAVPTPSRPATKNRRGGVAPAGGLRP